MMKFVVTRTTFIEIDRNQAEKVFQDYLSFLKDGRWTANGKLREEVYTSHRFDTDCDDQSDFELVATIEKLQKILKDRKK